MNDKALVVGSDIGIWSLDAHNSNLQKAFKHCETHPNSVTFTRGCILAAQVGRPLIHQYIPKKEAPVRRIVVPEKLICISASPCARWLAAGSASGQIYVWSLDSGCLVSTSDPHFQAVTALRWTEDGTVLISGSTDARVCIFLLMDIISSEGLKPTHILTHHSLKINDIFVGPGHFREARIFTASQDGTIGLLDVFSGKLIHNFVVGQAINALVVDPVERAIYAGTPGGTVLIELYKVSNMTGRLENIGIEGRMVDVRDPVVIDSGDTVSLALTSDGTQLVTGDVNGTVGLWSVGTNQLIRTVKHVKGRIATLAFVDTEINAVSDFPVLQRTVQDAPGDFVPCPLKRDLPPTGTFDIQEEYEQAEKLMALDASRGNVGSDSDQAPNSQQVSAEEYDKLKRMYDQLWTRYMGVIKE